LVVALAQQIVVQVALEQLLDELGHGASAAAVAHVHGTSLEVETQGKAPVRADHQATRPSAVPASRKRP